MFNLQRCSVLFALLGFTHIVYALELIVYNPAQKSRSPVSSSIIVSEREVMLIDAQLQRDDAHTVVAMITATGKALSTVYISHSDPEYYFGLEIIQAAFPKAHIVATQATVNAIAETKDDKLAYWEPILKDNAPKKLIVPTPLTSNILRFAHHQFEIKGIDPLRTFVWLPEIKTVIGGVVVAANTHVWMADTPTRASRRNWVKTLDQIKVLSPDQVVPGHYLNTTSIPSFNDSVEFTRSYIQDFEINAGKFRSSPKLIQAMKQHYPDLPGDNTLTISAKVIKKEIKWP